MDLRRVPDRWLSFYMAGFLVFFIGAVAFAKFIQDGLPILHDILLVIAGLLLAGLFSIAAVKRAKVAMTESDTDDEV